MWAWWQFHPLPLSLQRLRSRWMTNCYCIPVLFCSPVLLSSPFLIFLQIGSILISSWLAVKAEVFFISLKHVRVNVRSVQPLLHNPRTAIAGPFSHFLRHRCIYEEVRGSFLNKSEVADRVVTVVKNFQKVDPSKVSPNAHFQKDLGLDSLDTLEILMAPEEEFGFEIPDNEADKISSINLALDFIASHPQAK